MVTIVQGGDSIGTADRYPVLDSLRGLAALGVAFHHIPVSEALAVARWDDNFNLLLDLFFVISGFVIAAAYGERLSGGFPLRRFLWLRLGRIWPLHAAMLCVFILSMLALGLMRPELRTHGLMAGRYDPADLPSAFL
ncbi:MAG: acyltransferase, partial [Novosphingobium sp.]